MSLRLLLTVLCFLSSTSAQCQNQTCLVCSVFADYVLSFDSQETASQLSPCTYSLISSAPIPDLQVLGVFKPHHHLNVRFLDKVTVIYGNISVILKGGEAWIPRGDITQELGSGVVTVAPGLNMTRDQRFTRIDLKHGDYTLRLLYNQVSTVIRLTEPQGQNSTVDGLCKGNIVSADYQSECDTQYEDPRGAPYENNTLSICEVFSNETSTFGLRFAPVCPLVVKFIGDAEEHLTCTMKLFVNSVFKLYDDGATLKHQLNCDLQQLESCLTRVCGESEFCGATSQNKVSCFCHSSVYAQINETERVGVVQCFESNTTLTIPNCYLSEKGINHTQLHLLDSTCKGILDPQTQSLAFHSTKDNMCGTMLKMSNGSALYRNMVVLEPGLEEVADMSCPFSFPDISVDFDMSMSVVEDPSNPSGVVEYTSSALGNYTVLLSAFLDEAHFLPIDGHTRIQLDSPVYFVIQTHGLDTLNPVLVLDSCWAISNQDPNHVQKYYLIQNRCPSDPSVALLSSGLGSQIEFMFRMFQFVGSDSDIFLHCSLKLCLPQEGACVPDCSNRRRRSSAPNYIASFSIKALTWA